MRKMLVRLQVSTLCIGRGLDYDLGQKCNFLRKWFEDIFFTCPWSKTPDKNLDGKTVSIKHLVENYVNQSH